MTFQNKFIPANSAQISLLPLQKVQIYPAIFAKNEKKSLKLGFRNLSE